MAWRFSLAQDIGGRSEQQDRIAIVELPGKHAHLLVLADGMGGHRGGARAAEQVVAVARASSTQSPWSDPQTFLQTLCLGAHQQVRALDESSSARSPGSTCVFLLVRGPEAYWAHVGDSRLYHLRGGQLLSRTRDHSLAEMLSAGAGESESAIEVAPGMRNKLTMRLGGKVDPEPVCTGLVAEHGDLFALCSDGLWSEVPGAALAACSESGRRLGGGAARELVDSAREHAGPQADNVSLIMACWSDRRVRRRLFSRKRTSAPTCVVDPRTVGEGG